MVILSSPIITINVGDTKQLAKLLDEHATDYVEVLAFLSSLASSQGWELDLSSVVKIMQEKYNDGL